MRKFTLEPIFTAILISTSVGASAKDLSDRVFGFQVSIPDSFHEIAVGPDEPDTLYKFADGNPNPTVPPDAIQIQRLRGVISLHQRLNLDEIRKISSLAATLEVTTWSGLRLDVIRQVAPLPNQNRYVMYAVQFPLSGEAVQLHVGGPIAKDEAVRLLFKTEVASFKNTKPLVDDSSAPMGRVLTGEERITRLFAGIARLAITVAVLSFIVITILRSRRKKIPPKIEQR